MKALKVSIVIPVYNEAAQLGACLEAIAAQTIKPFEVIVVDNNSTDGTAAEARRRSFVTLLREKRQGVVYARSTGFDAARGNIIARIDADSIVAPDWVAQIINAFDSRPEVDALTGKIEYYGMFAQGILNAVDLPCRRYLAKVLGREVAIQGANMAMRRSAWRAVRESVCHSGGMHEDHDLAIHLNQANKQVIFHEGPSAAIDSRRLEANWRDFCYYAWLSPLTYKKHGLRSRLHMYPFVFAAIIVFPVLKTMRRGFDTDTQRFSLQQLFAPVTARANPATFVD